MEAASSAITKAAITLLITETLTVHRSTFSVRIRRNREYASLRRSDLSSSATIRLVVLNTRISVYRSWGRATCEKLRHGNSVFVCRDIAYGRAREVSFCATAIARFFRRSSPVVRQDVDCRAFVPRTDCVPPAVLRVRGRQALRLKIVTAAHQANAQLYRFVQTNAQNTLRLSSFRARMICKD